MNDVDELRQFVVVHARAQGIPAARYEPLLARVTTDADWVREWSAAARAELAQDRPLEACRYFNMARFPFIDGPDRAAAHAACLDAFDRWRSALPAGPNRPAIERIDVDQPGGRVRCWTVGLSPGGRRPLLLVMGGIVTIKEQWAPILLQAWRLGMAGVVTEMPGVGEHGAQYTPESWRMLPAVLDKVRDRCDVSSTVAVALSFSGHMALRCAADDPRIGGIITSGAPVSAFFTDKEWRTGVPAVTLSTLDHLTGGADLGEWALDPQILQRVRIPVHYLKSTRDEIIPAAEADTLRTHVRHAHIVEQDDVHGSPVTSPSRGCGWPDRSCGCGAGSHCSGSRSARCGAWPGCVPAPATAPAAGHPAMTRAAPLRTPCLARPPDATARLRLFCFHHAGGAASAFAGWQEALGPDVSVVPVQLPGRRPASASRAPATSAPSSPTSATSSTRG